MDSNNNNHEEEQALPFNGDASNFRVNLKKGDNAGRTVALPQETPTAHLQSGPVGVSMQNPQMGGYSVPQMGMQPNPQMGMQPNPQMSVQPNPQMNGYGTSQMGTQLVNQTGMAGANNMVVTGVPAAPKKQKDKGVLIAVIFSICAVIALCGVGAYFLFFSKDKKVERTIKKAETALENHEYSKAAELYEEALEEDPDDIELNYGLLSAYYGAGKTTSYISKFASFRGVIEKLTPENVEKYRTELDEMYRMALEIEESDDESYCTIALSAYRVLSDGYFLTCWEGKKYDMAESYYNSGLYADALYQYYEITQTDPDNITAQDLLTNTMRDTLDSMISMENFEDARDMINDYGEYIPGINYDDYLGRIDSMETLSETGHRFMSKVEAAMAASDYDTMCTLDGSEDSNTLLSLVEGGCYLYAEDGLYAGYTGKATGLYLNKDGSYYFYYGDYEDGVRCGEGKTFMVVDVGGIEYYLYDGHWENDAPNGYGTSIYANTFADPDLITTTITGTYKDGIQDGHFDCTIESSDGYSVYGSWEAVDGTAPDVRDQYPDKEFSVSEGRVMYCVLESDETEYYWYRSYKDGDKMVAANWKIN